MFHVEQHFKKDQLVYKAKDYIKRGEVFLIYKDNSSGILWTDFSQNLSHKENYNSIQYTPHSKKTNLFKRVYKISQNLMLLYKRILLGREIIVSERGLDFGSGDGAFFSYMSSSSFTIDALDPFFKAKNINSIWND